MLFSDKLPGKKVKYFSTAITGTISAFRGAFPKIARPFSQIERFRTALIERNDRGWATRNEITIRSVDTRSCAAGNCSCSFTRGYHTTSCWHFSQMLYRQKSSTPVWSATGVNLAWLGLGFPKIRLTARPRSRFRSETIDRPGVA